MEREKGFEPPAFPVVSRTYDDAQGDGRGSTRPADASGHVATEPDGGDVQGSAPRLSLPSPSPELFIAAGAIVAGRAASAHQPRSAVDGYLRRAMDQADALRAAEPA